MQSLSDISDIHNLSDIHKLSGINHLLKISDITNIHKLMDITLTKVIHRPKNDTFWICAKISLILLKISLKVFETVLNLVGLLPISEKNGFKYSSMKMNKCRCDIRKQLLFCF